MAGGERRRSRTLPELGGDELPAFAVETGKDCATQKAQQAGLRPCESLEANLVVIDAREGPGSYHSGTVVILSRGALIAAAKPLRSEKTKISRAGTVDAAKPDPRCVEAKKDSEPSKLRC